MFAGLVPATVEWVVEEAGLTLYSALIKPAKGGPLLKISAQFPHKRRGLDPLDKESSDLLRSSLKEAFLKRKYKARVKCFWSEQEEDYDFNDFKIEVLLKEKDYDAELYHSIRTIYKNRRKPMLLVRDML